MGCGLLFFLALISYTPADLPSWVKFSRAAANAEITNFIGPLGAVVAGYAYFFLGAACFLIPAILVWFGFQSLLGTRVLTLRNIAACTALVASGACLADVQSLLFLEWPARFNIYSPGGAIGYVIGQYILLKTIGNVGSIIVATTIYCVSLIVITGLHPMVFLHASYQGLKNFAANRREARAIAAEEAAAEAEAAASLAQDPALDIPAPTRRSRTKTKVADPEPTEITPELPLQSLPTPKIIDSSVRDKNEKKPTLAELMAGRKKSKKKEHLAPEFAQFKDYSLPGSDILDPPSPNGATPANKTQLLAIQNIIVETLGTFGITVTPGDITRGPTITRYEILPSRGLRVNRITALEADLARATKAERINIIAPIPGKDTVGIEIANSQKVLVPLRELLEDPVFHSNKYKIPLALGKDVYGRTIVGDLAAMPHCLIAGATGSGKSVCINSVIASILYRFSPDELRFIMIDPKVVEMQTYDNLPHLVVPVVTDPKKVILALRWVVNEMERRYRMFASQDVRDFDSFNSRKARRKKAAREAESTVPPIEKKEETPAEEELVMHAVSIGQEEENTDTPPTARAAAKLEFPEEEIPDKVPYIVVIIDELADLMQTAPVEVEGCIQRLAQKARAAGIHIILATQTPRKEVITGNIKTNIPTRIAFQVPSKIDSRVILDSSGAEKLVGQGDMLYLPPGSSTLQRAQGAFVTDQEIERLVEYCTKQADPAFEISIKETLESGAPQEETEVSDEDEEIIEKCIEVIQQEKRASTSLLQRRLRLGYTRAARMIDILEERGIIGPGDGAKPREILIDLADTVD